MCECKNIVFGSYDNQIQVGNLPPHMHHYKQKQGGDPDSICLDACIAQEVQDLWSLGITTTGCCCGHNELPGFIGVVEEDIPRMKQLGYEVMFNPSRPGDEDSFYATSIPLLAGWRSVQPLKCRRRPGKIVLSLVKVLQRVRLALHNIVGHPLMEVAYIVGLRRLGNWIHNDFFKTDHDPGAGYRMVISSLEQQIHDKNAEIGTLEKMINELYEEDSNEKVN